MFQCLKTLGDKGINRDKSAFIPFPALGAGGGIKGINPYRVYPLSHPRSGRVQEVVR